MKIAYVRVSSADQNPDRQIKALEAYGINEWCIEKASGKDRNRPEFQRMMTLIDAACIYRDLQTKKEDEDEDEEKKIILYIHDFSRLARSVKDLLSITDELKEKGVKIVSLKENIDTSTPTGEMMLTMIGAMNQFERMNILERQREGIAIAKAKGKYKGRKKIEFPKNWSEVYDKWKCRELSGTEAMNLLGLKRTTFYRLLKQYEDPQQKRRD